MVFPLWSTKIFMKKYTIILILTSYYAVVCAQNNADNTITCKNGKTNYVNS